VEWNLPAFQRAAYSTLDPIGDGDRSVLTVIGEGPCN